MSPIIEKYRGQYCTFQLKNNVVGGKDHLLSRSFPVKGSNPLTSMDMFSIV